MNLRYFLKPGANTPLLGFMLSLSITLGSCNNSNVQNTDDESDSTTTIVEEATEEPAEQLQLLDEEPVSKKADELFDDFFYNFISDSKFQSSRIDNALRKHKDNILEMFSNQDFFTVFYEDSGDLALLKDTTLTKVSVEWVDLENEIADKYFFRKIEGEWILTSKNESGIKYAENADFYEFYKHFSTDRDFQFNSLAENIRFAVAAGEEEEAIDTLLNRSDWWEFSMEMPPFSHILVNINYGQKLSESNTKNLLFEGYSNGITVDYRFEKEDGEWTLQQISL